MSGIEPADLSVYDRLLHSNEQIEQWLVSGAHQRELLAWLGEAEYALLAPLARAAASTHAQADCEVLLVPGILGTQLGRARENPWPPQVLWLDPLDVIEGRLIDLQLSGAHELQTMGALTYTYLSLKLRLNVAGFRVQLCDYDWRRDIAALGRQLGERIAASRTPRLMIVAHSMGGLLARVALQGATERVARVITIGTPHRGTLGALQALRGTYPTVRRLAALDRLHSAEQLTETIFAGFPSLYGMLPRPGVLGEHDLFDAAGWPATGPAPRPGLLREAALLSQQLAPADARFACIVGTGQRTATALTLRDGEFCYEVTSNGDGTVPASCAQLDGARNYFIDCEHSSLPRSPLVAEALIDLLANGATTRLHPQWTPASGAVVHVSEAVLRQTYTEKVDWRTLSPEQRRDYLNQLNLAPPQYWPCPPL